MRPPLDRPKKPPPTARAWDPFDDDPDDDDAPHPALTYKRPPGLRAVHGGVVSAVAAFGVVGVYAVFWFAVAFFFRTGALDWMEAERAAGRTVETGVVTVGGFPFDLRLVILAPRYGWSDGAGADYLWQADRLVLTAKPWAPGRTTARFSNTQNLTRTDADGVAAWRATSEMLAITYKPDGGLAGEGDLTVRGLRLVDGAGADVLSVASARVHYLGHDSPPKVKGGRAPLIETSVRLEGVRLAPRMATPLGRDITGIEGGLGLTGAFAYDGGDLVSALTAWRDGGGTVEVAGLGVRYGALKLGANGTMALDGALQPIGAFTVRAEGFFELVDALWREGLVAGRDAVTAKVVLGAFAKQRTGEARPSISLPITVQGRKLYAGPVPLMDVPLVTWPERASDPAAETETSASEPPVQ